MRFFRRIAGILGLGKDEGGHAEEEAGLEDAHSGMNDEPIPGPRKGFSVQVKVPAERRSLGPLVVPCNGDGGVQGLKWYAKRLKMDEDDDAADEFLEEVVPAASLGMKNQLQQTFPSFQVKRSCEPAKIHRQVMSPDGIFQQCIESEGRLQWV